jgi:hypothetical protein
LSFQRRRHQEPRKKKQENKKIPPILAVWCPLFPRCRYLKGNPCFWTTSKCECVCDNPSKEMTAGARAPECAAVANTRCLVFSREPGPGAASLVPDEQLHIVGNPESGAANWSEPCRRDECRKSKGRKKPRPSFYIMLCSCVMPFLVHIFLN